MSYLPYKLRYKFKIGKNIHLFSLKQIIIIQTLVQQRIYNEKNMQRKGKKNKIQNTSDIIFFISESIIK